MMSIDMNERASFDCQWAININVASFNAMEGSIMIVVLLNLFSLKPMHPLEDASVFILP